MRVMRTALCAGVLLCAGTVRAQVASELASMSLEDLLNTKVTVASKKAQDERLAPGIISVVTRDEIINSGARDLIDVLLQVPGFTFGEDTQGVVGVAFRGNWAHEGKILLLIDGQPMNELLYGTLQFGNHYPIDNIDRIEIIRGPGSVVYGGFAELAVISVITRSPEKVSGAAASWKYGKMAHALGYSNLNFEAGSAFGSEGLSAGLAGTYGKGNRSDGTYTDFSGGESTMKDNALNPRFFNGSVNYKDLHIRAVYDDYHTRSSVGEAILPIDEQTFQSYWLEAKYDWKVSDKLTLTPQLNYQWQEPWLILNKNSALFTDMTVKQYTAGLTASYDATQSVNVLSGFSAYQQNASVNDPDNTVGIGLQQLFEGKFASVRYRDIAVFGQATVESEIANLTVGARDEYHSQFGNSFVPRAALTKVFGDMYGKLLYSQAYRAPVVQNISLNPSIKPEKTTDWEAEIGYQFNKNSSLTANFFDITIKDPIVYDSQVIGGQITEAYYNLGKTGTRGAELSYRCKHARGYATASYSFQTSAGKNDVDKYKVEGRSGVLLGMPAHKFAFNGSLRAVDNLYVSPSAVLMSKRYAYTTGDGAGSPAAGSLPTTLYLNAFLTYRDAWLKGLDLSVGVNNIFNQDNAYQQPYNGGYAPLPGPSRELAFRLAYAFSAK